VALAIVPPADNFAGIIDPEILGRGRNEETKHFYELGQFRMDLRNCSCCETVGPPQGYYAANEEARHGFAY
jgi:hypothetical protein